jgi:glutamate synthase domain-containing protein 3
MPASINKKTFASIKISVVVWSRSVRAPVEDHRRIQAALRRTRARRLRVEPALRLGELCSAAMAARGRILALGGREGDRVGSSASAGEDEQAKLGCLL